MFSKSTINNRLNCNSAARNRVTHAITAALMLVGLALPVLASEPGYQPDSLSRQPGGFFYAAAGRSYLGVDIRDVTTDRVAALKLKEERGVEITMVDQDAPAGKAGLKEHDVILDFNGTAVESEEQIRRLIREVPPGRTVTVSISRDGSPMKISVQLVDHSAMVAQARPRSIIIPATPHVYDFPRNGMDIPGVQIQIYSAALGVQTENLTRQLGEFFGVKNGEGVLIRSVEKGSAAEKAGLKAGDVIVKADNEKLTDRSDLSHILRNHRSGGKVTLVVMRDKHEQTFVVTLADRGSRDSSMLGFDTEELQGSLGNVEEMLQGLEGDENIISLDGDLASLDGNLALLDLAHQGSLLELNPEMEKAMQQVERTLQELDFSKLKIGSDPI
jgi:serine protease Do